MPSSTNSVREFFDDISDTYGDKYSGSDAFYEYFFRERLCEATRNVDLNGKRILDIGAGTGSLYDHLKTTHSDFDYYATDISEGMLRHSSIPEERRFLGKVDELDMPVKEFDVVFLLGVTTYLDKQELRSTLDAIDGLLRPDGLLIVTFTNGGSVDWKLRRAFKLVGRGLVSNKNVLGQAFSVFPRRIEEMARAFGGGYKLEEIRFLNHTIFPINQVLKSSSIWIAKKIHSMRRQKLKTLLSSDFLMILRKV